MIRVPQVVSCPIGFNICFVINVSKVRRASTYKKCLFSGIFNRLGHFRQVFGHVKERLKLELRGMIRVPHLVACPMNFNLLSDRGEQGGVLNPTKNDHLFYLKIINYQVFLAVWVFFLTFLGTLRGGLLQNCTKS